MLGFSETKVIFRSLRVGSLFFACFVSFAKKIHPYLIVWANLNGVDELEGYALVQAKCFIYAALLPKRYQIHLEELQNAKAD